MQTVLKFFDFPFQGAGGQGTNKIGIKLSDRTADQLSGDENGFPEILAALTRIPPQELNASLGRLDWVPVEEAGGELAPLIDLTEQECSASSILQLLLLQQAADTPADPALSQISGNPAEATCISETNTGMPEMIPLPTDTAVAHPASTPDALHQQTQDGHPRAVPAQAMPPNGTLHSQLVQMVASEADGGNTVENKASAATNAVLSEHEGAPPVLTDRAAQTTGQNGEPSTGKTGTDSVVSDPQSLPPNALKKWFGNQALTRTGDMSGVSSGQPAVSDRLNSADQTSVAASSENWILKKRIEQKHRFVATVSQRQAAHAQKGLDANVAVAPKTGLQSSEQLNQQQLNQPVRADTTPAMREAVFAAKLFEGAEMQTSSNASGEGASWFDSQLSTTAPKIVEASTAAKQAASFSDRDTQTDVMRQIVQHMTLKNNRQQSQMVIRLKPDFLGNVRLHVTMEGHQVTVRIDADSYAVKDMVEQNIVHLKAELSQHGLEIERFDVFVGNDNDGWRSGQQQAGFRQASKRSGQPFSSAQTDEDTSDQSGDSKHRSPRAGAGAYSNSEVDYFV